MDIQLLIAFIIYFSISIIIGLISYFKTKNSKDFILGSRSLNYWVTAISAHASDMSSWLFMGFPAAIYSTGMLECWTAIGLTIFMFLNWQYIAPQLRKETEKYSSLTLSSYFENKFEDKTGSLRLISAIASLTFFTFYISSGLVGMGRLFESIFDIHYHTGIILGVAIIAFYTLIGGFFAVTWNDLFQGLFLLVMVIIVPLIAFFQMDISLESIKNIANLKNISLNLVPNLDFDTIKNIIFIATSWGLGYFGQPHILNKFMGIKNIDEMQKAKYLGITWQILTLSAAVCVGLIGIAFFQNGLDNNELIFVLMVKKLFKPFFAGIILGAILAATRSTIDSQILVSASILSEDLYKKSFNKNASQKQLLLASRLGVLIIAAIAFMIAFNNSQSVYDLVKYAWSGLGCSFGPLLLLCLHSNKINKTGAIAGILSGSIIAGIWPYINQTIPAMIPGFFLSLFLTYSISIFFKTYKKA